MLTIKLENEGGVGGSNADGSEKRNIVRANEADAAER